VAYGIFHCRSAWGGGCSDNGLPPVITPALLGPANNPITGVNIDPETQAVYPSAPLPFNLIGPYEMTVVSDYWVYCKNCDTTVQRNTQYRVLNSDGSPAANIPIGEIMGPFTDYDCSQPPSGSVINSCTLATGEITGSGVTRIKSAGMGATNGGGEFTDQWSLASDAYTPAGCGLSRVDQWQLCGLAYTSSSFRGQILSTTALPSRG
jgi:hypothetical protein